MSAASLIISANQADYVVGIRDPLPLDGFPAGKIRIRMTAGDLATASVRVPGGIRRFAIEQKAGKWIPAFEMCSNYTATNQDQREAEHQERERHGNAKP